MATTVTADTWADSHHRAGIIAVFRNTGHGGWPADFDVMTHGLVILFSKGNSGDSGRVHRASCRFVKRSINSLNGGSMYAEASAFVRHNSGSTAKACTVCGTDTVPPGACYFGETAEQVRDRVEGRALALRAERVQRAARNARERQHDTYARAQWSALQALREAQPDLYARLLREALTEAAQSPDVPGREETAGPVTG